MDTAYLTSSGFWQSDVCHVMVNGRDEAAIAQAEVLDAWCEEGGQLKGHFLFSTSGSTGEGKWVALSRDALLASAQAVNEHLAVTEDDHWLLALPTFHVGGMGIIARARLASCGLSSYENAWDAVGFHKALGDEITLTSLVPTQLADLVTAGLPAPDSLRVVLIGGGALTDDLYQQAVELGWPVIETYGMTEASSQIATASIPSRQLRLLPCWETKTDAESVLSIEGEPLLTMYLKIEAGQVVTVPALDDGWFVTNDRVEISDGTLVFKGRSDRCVKVLGELVDLAGVESQLQQILGGNDVAVVALPDPRRGSRMIAFVEQADDMQEVDRVLDAYNQSCTPVARIETISSIHALPRTTLGKIRYTELIDDFSDDKV